MNEIKYFSCDELGSKNFLSEICSFSKNKITQETFNKINTYFSKNKITQETFNKINTYKSNQKEQDVKKRLWAIFGRKDTDKWFCLQVGSSFNICSEIRENLNAMKSEPTCIAKSTFFHDNVYSFNTYMDKYSVKYRAMYDKCEQFIIYEIDVSEYLKDEDCGTYDEVNYAEVMFADETKAMFWNPAPATYGNQEREIYDNVFKINNN